MSLVSSHYVDCLQHQLAMDPRLWQLQGQASSRVLGVARFLTFLGQEK